MVLGGIFGIFVYIHKMDIPKRCGNFEYSKKHKTMREILNIPPIMRNSRLLLALLLMLSVSVNTFGKNNNAEIFVDSLLGKMTLREKIGQLNLLPTGPVTTAAGQNDEIFDEVRDGEVGGVFNLRGVHDNTIIQRMAVEETRLGIPILFGGDVIHGYETIFPLNIGLSCSWDMPAIEEMARISAKEATSAGIQWTFSPMVDKCSFGKLIG